LGRYVEAERAYERSVKVFRQSATDPGVLAWALTGLGRARLGDKRPAAAVAPLEEALAARVDKHASHAMLGETRFALARALWPRQSERPRARALAASARVDLADDKKGRAEIEAWLSVS